MKTLFSVDNQMDKMFYSLVLRYHADNRGFGKVVCPCFDRLFLPFFSWSTSTRDYKREPVPLAGTIFPISWYQKFHLVEQKVPIGGKVGTKFRGMRKGDASVTGGYKEK